MENETKVEKENKHVTIYNSLRGLDKSIDRLINLETELISGRESVPVRGTDPESNAGTLTELLNDTPNLITGYIKRINGCVNALRENLL